MNVYPIKIQWHNEEKVISLKLDLQRIRDLAAKTGMDILDLLLDAPTALDTMGDLLDAALRWKGNENPADLTGEALFDALVEQGTAGIADWMEISNGIATVSGVLQSQQAAAMLKSVRRRMEQAFERMEQAAEEAPEDGPSPAGA